MLIARMCVQITKAAAKYDLCGFIPHPPPPLQCIPWPITFKKCFDCPISTIEHIHIPLCISYMYCKIIPSSHVFVNVKEAADAVPSARCSIAYRIMQISPPLPSLIMRVKVSCSFFRASSGIRFNFACKSSLTNSWKLRPKMLDCQIFPVSPSNSWRR